MSYSEDFTVQYKRTLGKDFHFLANVGGTTADVFAPRFIEPATKKTIAAQIAGRSTFRVVFDRLPAAIGTLSPQAILTGNYNPIDGTWTVWSPAHPARPNHRYVYGPNGDNVSVGKIATWERPESGQLNLWGASFTFDESGRVFYSSYQTKPIGEISIAK